MIILVVLLILYGVVISISAGEVYKDLQEEKAFRADDNQFYKEKIESLDKTVANLTADVSILDSENKELTAQNERLKDYVEAYLKLKNQVRLAIDEAVRSDK